MKRVAWPAAIAALLLFLIFSLALAQAEQTVTVQRDANLRAGPGTTYAVVGGVKAGNKLTVVGKNPAGDWYELNSGEWIAAFLVKVDAVVTPTRVPTRSATAATAQGITQAEQTYVRVVIAQLSLISDALDRIGELSQIPLLTNQTWRDNLVTQLILMQSVPNEISKLEVPVRFDDFHMALVDGLSECHSASENIATGIDEFDTALLDTAAANINACGTKTVTAIGLLEDTIKSMGYASVSDALKATVALTPQRTATRRPAGPTPTPTSELEWYEGGTLHKATVTEWLDADYRNKLATVADWAYAVHKVDTAAELKPYAIELLVCIEEAIPEGDELQVIENSSVVEIAALCSTFMKSGSE